MELQALLLDSATLHDFLDRLAKLTARALPEGSSCGVTVRQNSRAVTLAASDEHTMRIDQLQGRATLRSRFGNIMLTDERRADCEPDPSAVSFTP